MTRRSFALVSVLVAQAPAQQNDKPKAPKSPSKTFRASEVGPLVKKIVVKLLDEDPDTVIDSARLAKDLGADSLDLVEIVMEVEERFDIEISDEEAEKIVTVGDLIQCVKRRLISVKRLA